MKIGFIGTGTMGEPMSANLLKKSGCPVMVYDINEDAVNRLAASGAVKGDHAASVIEWCDILFTMLPRDEHVTSVYEDLIPHVRQGQILVDMSTISPSVSRGIATRVHEKGGIFFDAPVVKSRPAAIEGTLGIYVGGPYSTYDLLLPFLQCMGSSVLYLGDHGAGLVMKLCHNMLVGQIQNGVNEMLHLARKAAGIDVQLFAQAAACGGAKNFYLESKEKALTDHNYTPAFAAEYMYKDVNLCRQLTAEAGMQLEGVELIVSRYEKAMELGLGKQDFSSTYQLFEEEDI